ncbi:retention module-containing protein, partial [Pseudomaricurvus alkylphenolicus]|uniref:retention module-containing protein n=1 Tax=Pseudomaricurvus alkylphenolicus TaxID=1306991 RepID=UPI00141DF31B
MADDVKLNQQFVDGQKAVAQNEGSSNVVGLIVSSQGEAVSKTGEGARTLAVGDHLRENDILQTGSASVVVLKLTNGKVISLGQDQQLTLDQQLFQLLEDIQQSTQPDQPEEIIDFDKIAEALEAGGDLNELLPAPAAGEGGGAEGGAGTPGIRIELTADRVTPTSGFETDGLAASTETTDDFSGSSVPAVGLTGTTEILEGESGLFQLNLNFGVDAEVTVYFSYSGVAQDGTDFAGVSSVTLPAGLDTAQFPINSIDNVYLDESRGFTITIEAVERGDGGAILIDSNARFVDVTIIDDAGNEEDDTATLTLTGQDEVVEGEAASYTLSLDHPAGEDLTIEIVTGFITAADGDLIPVNETLIIPAGETSISFTVQTLDNAYDNDARQFDISIAATGIGGFENLVIDNGTVATTIVDQVGSDAEPGPEDTAIITLSGVESVVEGEAATYTLSADPVPGEDLTVDVVVAHVSTDDDDLVPVVQQVVLPAGQASITFVVNTSDDAYADSGETFTVALTGDSIGGGYEAIELNTDPVTTTILDQTGSDAEPGPEDTATVTLSGDAEVVEGENATYTISVDLPTATDLTVGVTTGFISSDEGDLVPVNQSFVIPAGETSVSFEVETLDNAYADSGREFNVTLANTSGGGFENVVVDNDVITTTIVDQVGSDAEPGAEDTATISLTGDATVVEGETASYTLSVDLAPVTDLLLDVVTGHVTTDDGDLVPVSVQITIAAGTTSADFTVATLDDAYADSGEQFEVRVQGSTGGGFENVDFSGATTTTAILDQIGSDAIAGVEDTATLTLSGDAEVVEGESANYTLSVDLAPQTDIQIDVVVGHITTDEGDLSALVQQVTLPAGQTEINFTVSTLDDAYADSGERFSVSIESVNGGGFEALEVGNDSVETTILDQVGSDAIAGEEDRATVSIGGSETVVEGENASYTLTVDQVAATDLNVSVVTGFITADNGDLIPVNETFVIPAGETSVSFEIQTLDNAYDNDARQFDVTITEVTGGGFEQLSVGTATQVTTILDQVGSDAIAGEEDTAVVSLSGDTQVVEGEAASYTLSVTPVPAIDLVVDVVVGHLTTSDGDINAVVQQVTIPAGQNEVSFSVETLDDAYTDSGEQFNVSLQSFSGGGFEAVALDPEPVVTTILDQTGSDAPAGEEDTAYVSITGDVEVVEGESASYTLSVDKAPASDLQISVVTGFITADNGDLVAVNDTFVIAAGETSVSFSVETLDNAYDNTERQFDLQITTVDGGGFENTEVAEPRVLTTIVDQVGSDATPGVEDTAVISLAGAETVNEGDSAVYTITAGPAPAQDLVLEIVIGHITTDDGDVSAVTRQVTLPAGSTSVDFSVETFNDVYADGGEEFSVAVVGSSGGGYEAIQLPAEPVNTTIIDQGEGDEVVLNISGDTSVVEGESANYTLSVEHPVATPLSVSIVTGFITADNGDLVPVNETFVLNPGETSVSFQVETLDNAYDNDNRDFRISIDSSSGGGFENLVLGDTSVVTTILDQIGSDATPGPEDTATITLAGDASVDEGDTANYTVSVDKAPVSDLLVEIQVGHITTDDGDITPVTQQILIAAGTTSANFSVDTLDDIYVDSGEIFSISLQGSSGGGFENVALGEAIETTILDAGPTESATLTMTGEGPVVEGETAVCVLTVSHPPATDLTVTVVIGHITTDDGDLEAVTREVVIPAGATSVSFGIDTFDDFRIENTETAQVTITGTSGGGFEDLVVTNGTGIVEIQDNDQAGVRLIETGGSTTVSEDGARDDLVVVLTARPEENVTVTLQPDAQSDLGSGVGQPHRVTFTPDDWDQSQRITVRAFDDVVIEGNHVSAITGTVESDDPNFDGLPVDSVTASVIDNDFPAPGVQSVSGDFQTEGNTLSFSVTLSQATQEAEQYAFSVANISTVNSDYDLGSISFTNGVTLNGAGTQLTVPEGVSSFQVLLPTIDDVLDEDTEALSLSVGGVSAHGFIGDNDDTLYVSVATDEAVIEGNQATFTFSQTSVASENVVISFSISGDVDGSDYVAPLGYSVVIPAGDADSQVTINLQTIADEVFEGAEDLTVTINSVVGAGALIGTGSATTVVLDSNEAPLLSIDDVTVNEDADYAEFTISLSTPSAESVSFDLSLSNAGATGSGVDYGAVGASNIQVQVGGSWVNAASATIAAGDTEVKVRTPVVDDFLLEGDEGFTLNATSIINASNTSATGNGLITDAGSETDDPEETGAADTVYAVISGPSAVVEGNTTTDYTVSLIDASGNVVTVTSDTDVTVVFTNGTAEAGDYDAAPQTVTISSGSSSATFTVDTVEDADFDDETFTASIQSVQDTGEFETIDITNGASGQTPTQTTTIREEDTAPTIRINDVTVNEDAGTATFTVSLSHATTEAVTFDFATSDDSATAGADYTANSGSGSIGAGETQSTLTVAITDDFLKEGDETYTVTLSNLSANVAATGNDLVGVGTITDAGSETDDPETVNATDTVYAVISGPATVTEGATTTNYTVSLIDASGNAVTVNSDTDVTVVFTNGSAEAGDYDATSQTVTISSGSSSTTLTVDTHEDADFDNETFTASIQSVEDTGQFEAIDTTNGADGQTPSQLTTIQDNDTAPTIRINDVTVNEDAGTATFTVSLSHATTEAVTFDFATSDDSATAGADYTANSGNGSIGAGDTETTITVAITDDFLKEGDETYDVTLSNLSANVAATGNDLVGVGTITDAGSETDDPETVNATDTVYAVISGPATVTEGATTTDYTVSLIDASGNAVTVNADTDVTVVFTNGSAEVGDYDATSQTVTISSGASSTTLTVDTHEDADFDNDTFTASIQSVEDTGQFEAIDTTNGADGQTPSQLTTIQDNDTAPTIRINDVTVNEDAGTATFTVSLSHATTEAVTFDFATSDDSAIAGADYAANSGSGSIGAGDTQTTLTVAITDDFLKEGDETYNVTLSNLSANVAAAGNDLVGVGTITDAGSETDDPEDTTSADTVYAVISGPATVTEGA